MTWRILFRGGLHAVNPLSSRARFTGCLFGNSEGLSFLLISSRGANMFSLAVIRRWLSLFTPMIGSWGVLCFKLLRASSLIDARAALHAFALFSSSSAFVVPFSRRIATLAVDKGDSCYFLPFLLYTTSSPPLIRWPFSSRVCRVRLIRSLDSLGSSKRMEDFSTFCRT